MIVTTKLERIFLFKQNGQDIRLSDPSPAFSPEQVLNFYSGTYPILTTARIEAPEIVKDKWEFRFSTTIGTKG